MLSEIMRKYCTMLPMLFHAVWYHDKMLYHAPHAFPCCLKSWENAVPCFPCFPMLFDVMKMIEELPCSPCFPMLSEIMRKCCSMLPMLFHAILNDEKVLSHEFHANPCSAGVTWKIFPCFHAFPCFCIAWKSKGSMGSMGSMGKPWSPHEFHAFPHASYTRVVKTWWFFLKFYAK